MSALLVNSLFAAALAASVWTLLASIRPQLHRFRELFGMEAAAPALPVPVPSRITVRRCQPHPAAATPLRAAA